MIVSHRKCINRKSKNQDYFRGALHSKNYGSTWMSTFCTRKSADRRLHYEHIDISKQNRTVQFARRMFHDGNWCICLPTQVDIQILASLMSWTPSQFQTDRVTRMFTGSALHADGFRDHYHYLGYLLWERPHTKRAQRNTHQTHTTWLHAIYMWVGEFQLLNIRLSVAVVLCFRHR